MSSRSEPVAVGHELTNGIRNALVPLTLSADPEVVEAAKLAASFLPAIELELAMLHGLRNRMIDEVSCG